MRTLFAAALAIALPAFAAGDGYFPRPEVAQPAVLKVLQCKAGQSMACTVRCPAPADGKLPAAAACAVLTCVCDDEPAKPEASTTLVNFKLRELLGLPQPK